MARIAYVDHSYHKKTTSTKFIIDALEAAGHSVELFWDESWSGGLAIPFEVVVRFDVVVMFQSYCDLADGLKFSNLHHNVVYIPMLDQFGVWRGAVNGLNHFWMRFEGSKVINFSLSAHALTAGAGIRSELFRFYRKPQQKSLKISGLHGFLWVRLQQSISWQTIKKLIGDTHFDSFCLHIATDPGSTKIELPSQDDIEKYNIKISHWFENKSELEEILKNVNVFFAPRVEEGIGQSFLEAFSRGQCVVAANHGTMNEYIQHGFTGLLYDIKNPQPVDFSNVQAICENTYQACQIGYHNWLFSQKSMVDYILMPNEDAYHGLQKSFTDNFKSTVMRKLSKNIAAISLVRRLYKLVKKLIKSSL